MLFNDRRMSANDRALKAAQGPSLASKRYKPDTKRREAVKNLNWGEYPVVPGSNRKQDYAARTRYVDRGSNKALFQHQKGKW